MSAFLEERVLSVHHWTDRLFSFTTTRDTSLRFSNGHFTMIGLKVDGKPFKLDDRPAMAWIYDQVPSALDEAYRLVLVLMKCAQVGFTVSTISPPSAAGGALSDTTSVSSDGVASTVQPGCSLASANPSGRKANSLVP